jgi:hypothetical protein
MDDAARHINITEENLQGAIDEMKNKRFANVGLLSLRALEQMVEACASKEGLHFHEHPRTAHRNRRNWLKNHHPDLLEAWDQLWGLYGALGYGGLNGERAEQALTILKECLTELSRREKIAITGV